MSFDPIIVSRTENLKRSTGFSTFKLYATRVNTLGHPLKVYVVATTADRRTSLRSRRVLDMVHVYSVTSPEHIRVQMVRISDPTRAPQTQQTATSVEENRYLFTGYTPQEFLECTTSSETIERNICTTFLAITAASYSEVTT